jgi:hypothetical protein
MPSGFTLVSNVGLTSLAPGQSTSFTVRLDATTSGSFGGSIQLANNDSNENPYDLTLVGGVAAAATPQITLLVGGQTLAAGGTVDFGSTIVGTTLERTITIRNDGNATLTLTPLSAGSMPAGFSLLQNFGATSLAPGATTSFIVRLTAQAAGTFSGQISVLSNDAAHSPFAFTVSGAVAAAVTPLTQVVDDGNAGNALVGAWTRTANKGYGNDIHTAYKGLGYVYSTWSFSSLPQGQYRVYATWTVNGANATNAPFTILDGTTLRSSVAVNQRLVANDLNADGGHWKLLGNVTVNSGQLVVKLTNLANGYVIADAVRIERVTNAAASQPEIDVLAGGTALTSGGVVAFGQQDLGSPRTIDFTITNSGTASLSLTPLDPTKLPSGFSLVSNIGTTLLTPGETTTFSLQLTAQAAGSFSGTISLANNDPNESTFTFQVTGSVVDPNAPVTKIIDAGKAGNQLVGFWSHNTARGYGGEMYTANKGTGSITSTWSFTALPPGTYEVQATWRISTLNATNAPFTVYNGSQAAFTTKVNQQLTPAGYWDGTTLWQSLGTVTVTGSSLVVRLTNAANGLVVADAIRIVRVAAGASPLASSDSPITAANNSALAALLSTNQVAAGQPSAVRSLPASIVVQPVAAGHVSSAALPDALPSLLTELEDRVLADTLDLLSQARAARSGNSGSAADLHAAALLALLNR